MEEKQKVWFASDHHFGHEFMQKMRNFKTIEEHDQTLIEAHNKVVKKGDDVYFLGDFTFKGTQHWQSYTEQLNGNLHLIRGNHDCVGVNGKTYGFSWIKDYHEQKVNNILLENFKSEPKILLCLFHYPIYCHHKNKRGSIMLHGHTHSAINGTAFARGKIKDMEVCVSNNWEPYELKDILLEMQDRPIFAPDCVNY